jgi:hypothetical protein
VATSTTNGGPDDFRVSNSKVKTWRRCRRAYHLKYVEKLEKKRVSRPLQFGRLVHSMIEYHAQGLDPFAVLDELSVEDQKLFKAEREMYGDIISDVRCIMEEYFDYHGDDSLRALRVNGRYAEHEFNTEIAPGILLTGKIDMIARTPNKLRWLVEHKSFNRLPSEDERWRNVQSVVYFKAIELLGWKPVDGVCWDYIHSKSPTRPEILKNGQMTKKALTTLPSRVLEVAKEHKLKREMYAATLEMAKSQRKYYFQRSFNPIKPVVVKHVWNDFLSSSKEMRDCHGKSHERNIDRHCSWCDFEPLCRAELSGHDTDFIRRNDYRERIREEQSTADGDAD